MKPFPFLFTALFGLASAKCYSTGEKWVPDLAYNASTKACQGLAGSYRVRQDNSKSIDVGNGQCYFFYLQRLRGGDTAGLRSITQEECENGMGHEISGCERGGKSSYKNWMYK